MKKTSIIFILCLLSSFLLFSQEIKVTSPVSGDSWKLGTTHPITWNYNGPASTDMKINVFKDSINQSNFVEQLLTKNDHTENLFLGSKYTTGKYILRIKTSDNLHHGDSALFDVYDDIKITSPKSGDKWKLGSTYAIKWTFDAPSSTDMKINVYKNSISQSNFVEQLLTKNDLTENLSLGSKYAVGKYIIRVKTADSKYHGDSDVFRIIRPMLKRISNLINADKLVIISTTLPDLIVTEISQVVYGYTQSDPKGWTIVKVKVKNKGNYVSQQCLISLQGNYTTKFNRYGPHPCHPYIEQRKFVPPIPPGKTITGFLPVPCSDLGDPKNKFDIEVVVNPSNIALGGPFIKESNYSNNKLIVNITRLNAIRDYSSGPSSHPYREWWLTE